MHRGCSKRCKNGGVREQQQPEPREVDRLLSAASDHARWRCRWRPTAYPVFVRRYGTDGLDTRRRRRSARPSMSYMSNIAAATGPISMLDVAEACGLTGGGEITITSFYCGGCNLPVTSTSMPNAGAIDFAAMRNAKVIYSPEALTSTLDMTYPSTPAAIAAFESGFIADLASNLHLPASLLAVTTSPGPGGVGTVVTSVVTLPYNQAVAGAALGRLSAAASTNDPSVLVGPSTRRLEGRIRQRTAIVQLHALGSVLPESAVETAARARVPIKRNPVCN